MTVVTDEPQTLTQQGLGCVTDLCQIVTDKSDKDSQTLANQALQPVPGNVTDAVTDIFPLVFAQGDRVQHPSYGPGTIEIVNDELYCQWDELGGTMRLIPEDFQVMTKIP